MVGQAAHSLSEKQREVIERIDRRMPIKVIASELGVSETRINQHIRALKQIYDAASLNELVESYRLSEGRSGALGDGPEAASYSPVSGPGEATLLTPGTPLRNAAYSKKQMGDPPHFRDLSVRDDPGLIRMSDAHVVARDALWAHDIEPVVVFGALNGKHAVLYRSMVMVGLAFGMIAGVVLVVSAALSLSEVLDGRASVTLAENADTG